MSAVKEQYGKRIYTFIFPHGLLLYAVTGPWRVHQTQGTSNWIRADR